MDKSGRKFRRTIGVTLFIIAAVFIVPVGIIHTTRGDDMSLWAVSMFEQFVIGIFSIAFALIVVDPVINHLQQLTDEEHDKQKLKQELLAKLRSRIDGVAARAIEELQRNGWIKDGSLSGLNLCNANLSEASLLGADLRNGAFDCASLQRADLRSTNLEAAVFDEADLRGADLSSANLRSAVLEAANLEKTFLDGADLRGASLNEANLRAASLYGAELKWSVLSDDAMILPAARFDEETCLPDGTMWTPQTDLRRFTDENHPEFWRPYWLSQRTPV